MEEKKKEIEKQMLSIYEEYQSKSEDLVRNISYHNQLIMQNSNNKIMYGMPINELEYEKVKKIEYAKVNHKYIKEYLNS